jgi:ubiquinone/menaquinone biosynthesis C-methylase UbiE
MLSGRRGLKWRLLPLVRMLFAATGRRWVDFYAWMLDRQEHRNSLSAILREAERRAGSDRHKGLYDLSAAEQHVMFMRAEGLTPEHAIIDFGCGFGRTAIPLLRYLEPGRYKGVEISKERLRIADEYVAHEALGSKSPQFVLSRDLGMPYAEDASADMIWALTVVSHMPMADIKRFLTSAFRVLRPGGVVLFDYISADRRDKTSIKDFRYTAAEMEDACRAAGFRVAQIDTTRHDAPPEWRSAGASALRLDKP